MKVRKRPKFDGKIEFRTKLETELNYKYLRSLDYEIQESLRELTEAFIQKLMEEEQERNLIPEPQRRSSP